MYGSSRPSSKTFITDKRATVGTSTCRRLGPHPPTEGIPCLRAYSKYFDNKPSAYNYPKRFFGGLFSKGLIFGGWERRGGGGNQNFTEFYRILRTGQKYPLLKIPGNHIICCTSVKIRVVTSLGTRKK